MVAGMSNGQSQIFSGNFVDVMSHHNVELSGLARSRQDYLSVFIRVSPWLSSLLGKKEQA